VIFLKASITPFQHLILDVLYSNLFGVNPTPTTHHLVSFLNPLKVIKYEYSPIATSPEILNFSFLYRYSLFC
jgi:hypothetical protein